MEKVGDGKISWDLTFSHVVPLILLSFSTKEEWVCTSNDLAKSHGSSSY